MTINLEAYNKIKSRIGFFDASDRFGRLNASGKDAIDLLHRLSTNDLRALSSHIGTGRQTVLTSEKGRIIDLITVFSREQDNLIVTSHGRETPIVDWLEKYTIMEDAQFRSVTSTLAQFVICGPRSADLIRNFVGADLDLISLEQFVLIAGKIDNIPVLFTKSYRLAESGWWIFVEKTFSDEIKSKLMAEVLAMDGAVLDDSMFDVFRIESGIPQYPSELNDKRNPLETTLVNAVSFTKGCYIGQEVIARLDSYDKVQRHMMGLEIEGHIADVESEIRNSLDMMSAVLHDPLLSHSSTMLTPSFTIIRDDKEIGELTSTTVSPGLKKVIGLGFIRTPFANPGQSVGIRLRADLILPAKLVKLPFDTE